MVSRRNFTKSVAMTAAALWLGLGEALHTAWAETKRRLVPPGTSAESLANQNPNSLDASQLEVTPTEHFGTMGLTNHPVDIAAWRLEVTGKVDRPLRLTYAEVTGLPTVERKELLICPGFFSYQALYRGVMLGTLLEKAGMQPGARRVVISGPAGDRQKRETFTMAEIEAGRVFLAWAVNGQTLPMKHGYPLRAVAPDRYGDDWVKYVARLEVS